MWTLQEGQLRPVRVHTGISDGTATAVLGGPLTEDMQIVTGTAAPTAQASQSTNSPLVPFGGRRPGAGRQGATANRSD